MVNFTNIWQLFTIIESERVAIASIATCNTSAMKKKVQSVQRAVWLESLFSLQICGQGAEWPVASSLTDYHVASTLSYVLPS